MRRAPVAVVAVLVAALLVGCDGRIDSVTNVTQTSATLNAHYDCAKDEAGQYWLEHRRVGSTGAWAQVGRQSFSCTSARTLSRSFQVTGLTAATTYEARMCADPAGSASAFCSDSDGTLHLPSDNSGTRSDITYFRFSTLAGSCNRSATNASTLASQFAAATAGQTICLASGGYGTFTGGQKSGMVTIRSASGRGAAMALNFTNVANVKVDSVTVTGGSMQGSTHDVTVSNSKFTSRFFVSANGMSNANVVFDGNDHLGVRAQSATVQPAQLMVDDGDSRAAPSGVVVRNSKFGGSATNADGIRCDVGNGMTIENNDFSAFDDVDPYHTDPIQIYGGKKCVIRRNFFHDMGGVSAYIMQADGGYQNIIEDNVFKGGAGVTYGITLYSDNGSIIRHNTFGRGVGGFNVPSGTLNVGHKSGQPAGSGTLIENNIIASVSAAGSTYTARYNLTQSPVPGTGNIVGTPVFVGPLTTYAGYRLAAGSPGKGKASTGIDVGIR
jgi:hypothetical protein